MYLGKSNSRFNLTNAFPPDSFLSVVQGITQQGLELPPKRSLYHNFIMNRSEAVQAINPSVWVIH